jgi:hypothetical protein
MKIEGTTEIPVERQRVWEALLDPKLLAAAMPGCDKLEEIGSGEYKAIMKIGIGPVKGTFEGKVHLSDLEPPNRYRMAVEGSGAPGFVRGTALMELADGEGGATRVHYDADVQVGGLIASVGQRMLGGVSKMMLDQFFSRMIEALTAGK